MCVCVCVCVCACVRVRVCVCVCARVRVFSQKYMRPLTVMIGVCSGNLRDVTGEWTESFLAIGTAAMVAAIVNLAEPLAARYARKQTREASSRGRT